MLDSNIDTMEGFAGCASTIWGLGLCYEYDQNSGHISIIHAQRYQPIIDVYVDINTSIYLSDFIHTIEKITQIQALILSNNATCDITEILTRRRMKVYFEYVIETARRACYLRHGDYDSFIDNMCEDFGLSGFNIENLNKGYSNNNFFKLSIHTKRGNVIACEGFHLRYCLSTLSQKTISDLLVVETSHNFQADARRLLKMSSNLSMLARVLDEQFIPRRKVKLARTMERMKSA